MEQQINYKPNKAFWCVVIIIILTAFLIVSGKKASGQEITNYYATQVTLTRTDGSVAKDVWMVGYGFDEINSLAYFNIQPNESEEFTICHKVYTVEDTYDGKGRLKRSEYILDDRARLYIIPTYDDPDIPIMPTGYYFKLVEQPTYTIRKEINKVEFLFFTNL